MVSSGTGSPWQSGSGRQPSESAGPDSLSLAGGGPRCAAAPTAWSPVDTCNVCCKLAQTEFRPTRLRLQIAGVGLNGKAQEARSRRTWRRMTRGQALVELAIILPVLLVLVLAAIDLGRIFFAQITVANSAREGAYEASYGGSYVANAACGASNTVMCAILNEAQGSLTIAPADVVLDVHSRRRLRRRGVRRCRHRQGHRSLQPPDADPCRVLRRDEHGVQLDRRCRHRRHAVTAGSTPTAAPTATPVPTPTVLPTVTPFPTPSGPPAATPTPSAPTCSSPVANFTFSQQNKNKPVDFVEHVNADVRQLPDHVLALGVRRRHHQRREPPDDQPRLQLRGLSPTR